jgi:hypothetical protein
MNLGKLLGAGKTFFGGGGSIAYRENKRIYLPKFNAERNPFTPKPAESAPVMAPAVVPAAEKLSAPVAAPAQKIPVFAAPQPKLPMPARATSWTDKLNPFRTPPPARPIPPSAVQVELSLEAVKVVHNDLADADIEIVPVKSRTVAQPEAPMLPPARASWEFLGERLVNQI